MLAVLVDTVASVEARTSKAKAAMDAAVEWARWRHRACIDNSFLSSLGNWGLGTVIILAIEKSGPNWGRGFGELEGLEAPK